MTESTGRPALLGLPAELLHQILAYLEPLDLGRAAQTCKVLATQTYDDQIWMPLVNQYLPEPLTGPAPSKTFREVYIAHHPYWFLVKRRLWFGDIEHVGKLVAARYDARRGCIEAYTVAAQRGRHTLEFWEKDREVIIHSFNPKIVLDMNRPVLKLDLGGLRTDDQPDNEPSARSYAPPSNYSKEILMETLAEAGLYSSFMLCRALPEKAITEQTAVWPPLRFPTPAHVRNNTHNSYQSTGHRPSRLDEVSQYHFRLRKWVEFNGRRASPLSLTSSGLQAALGMVGPYFAANLTSSAGGGMSIRMQEGITTFASLPDWCFTPTPQKPWQGLWCGDYSGHGCEFLVVLQPDKQDERPLPEGMDWLRQWFRGQRRGSGSSDSSYASAQEDFDVVQAAREQVALELASWTEQEQYQVPTPQAILEGFTETPFDSPSQPTAPNDDAPSGRLEAIKLTGDPNIPRGEYTFVAPEIGEAGLLRVADEKIFKGARIVRSAGHIAGRGFREGEHFTTSERTTATTDACEDQYTPSQLIMISHDRLAQFWEGFGHISYYQRVDLDALMKYTGLALRDDSLGCSNRGKNDRPRLEAQVYCTCANRAVVSYPSAKSIKMSDRVAAPTPSNPLPASTQPQAQAQPSTNGEGVALLCMLYPESPAKQQRCLSLLRKEARDYYPQPKAKCTTWSYFIPMPARGKSGASEKPLIGGLEIYTAKSALQAQLNEAGFQGYHETVKREELYAKPEELVAWYHAAGFVARDGVAVSGEGVLISVTRMVCKNRQQALDLLR
ncbi:hypothetical protein BAUCODRAFT_25951 [Baudoinia panamericana UAMH 10762]|uniref:F-box domain-containing protein n=1 Tax=Baudoinia panamericana (strain UAMH 10762) TaxID=717646 RepID=M2MTI4_BAUPA|nr:uncharacterized protein BAUCODRAFT_25951 [Baudoinia panamericana UAMH 10762]EMC94848.1 hypothetical protein BAUCODRAFT_25951 [Baudoinia panamericana UAMH 10762]